MHGLERQLLRTPKLHGLEPSQRPLLCMVFVYTLEHLLTELPTPQVPQSPLRHGYLKMPHATRCSQNSSPLLLSKETNISFAPFSACPQYLQTIHTIVFDSSLFTADYSPMKYHLSSTKTPHADHARQSARRQTTSSLLTSGAAKCLHTQQTSLRTRAR
jgi:hypothetical protein